ncbi:hypothetical protein GWI33_000131 [Rhynchophorus ferrugineus]|uniref:Carboxypeptidase n=1 Tax=Rhynchophorus ferrugineus TaxID=354439 RepID=A0A834IY83_RHYFE|nr:hypothetical protein GWI33_000131 [Rhynchophorus ferrugineus]
MKIFLSFILLYYFKIINSAFPNFYTKIPPEAITGNAGNPLILTPLIEQNKIQEAQNASLVTFNGFKNFTSYSGYLTVDKDYNSNMFFWYFPSTTDSDNDPVVLWLQGGPGASSMIGLFTENGPFSVKFKKGLRERQYTWVHNHNMLYIDNPVGTGYSFTSGGYAQTENKVGEDLYSALIQFFTLFPKLQKNPFFVSGESYGGKYVPAVSYIIHSRNHAKNPPQLKINLQGLSIGNGLTDPINQLKYSDYLYQIGLIDSNGRKVFQSYEQQATSYIQNNQFIKAFKVFDELLNGDTNNHTSIFKNITGFDNYFNYLYPVDPLNTELLLMGKYIQRLDVRQSIHVGNTSFNIENQIVEQNLMNDVMQSIASWLSELLNNYRVLIYNGQLDIIINIKLLQGINGHMVPADQPAWAFDLISRFTRNKTFY